MLWWTHPNSEWWTTKKEAWVWNTANTPCTTKGPVYEPDAPYWICFLLTLEWGTHCKQRQSLQKNGFGCSLIVAWKERKCIHSLINRHQTRKKHNVLVVPYLPESDGKLLHQRVVFFPPLCVYVSSDEPGNQKNCKPANWWECVSTAQLRSKKPTTRAARLFHCHGALHLQGSLSIMQFAILTKNKQTLVLHQ